MKSTVPFVLVAAFALPGCKAPVPPEVTVTLEKAAAWRSKVEQIVAEASKPAAGLPGKDR